MGTGCIGEKNLFLWKELQGVRSGRDKKDHLAQPPQYTGMETESQNGERIYSNSGQLVLSIGRMIIQNRMQAGSHSYSGCPSKAFR